MWRCSLWNTASLIGFNLFYVKMWISQLFGRCHPFCNWHSWKFDDYQQSWFERKYIRMFYPSQYVRRAASRSVSAVNLFWRRFKVSTNLMMFFVRLIRKISPIVEALCTRGGDVDVWSGTFSGFHLVCSQKVVWCL